MSSKIIFGSDLIDVLENKYNMNKLGEVPTKYKNGVTIIDFIYGKEKDIDDLKYNKPYVEFSIDDETDGFISGTMYLNGVESVQFDSWDDLKYFVKNAKWTESEKYTRKSIKENLTRYDMIGQGFFVLISNISFGLCEQLGNKTQDTHWIRSFDTEKQAINFANKKGYPIIYEKFNESKKSMKEGKDSAFYDGIAKEFHFSKDEKNRYKDKTYISAIAVLFDRINNAIKTYGRNSDEEYNALNDCWEVILSAKQNGFNVDYDEDRWNKIAGLPNYH